MRSLLICILAIPLMGLKGGCGDNTDIQQANVWCFDNHDCELAGLIDYICVGEDSVDPQVDLSKICVSRKAFERIVIQEKIVEVPVEKIVEVPVEVCTLPDGGTPDAGPADAGSTDGGIADAGTDAGQPDAGVIVVENIAITDIVHVETETCSTISWNTSVASPSILHITAFVAGTALDFTKPYQEYSLYGQDRTYHQQLVCGMNPAEKRTFRIMAQATNAYGEVIGTFTTLERKDRDPPTAVGREVSCSTVDCEVLVLGDEQLVLTEVWIKVPNQGQFTKAATYPLTPHGQYAQLSLAGLNPATAYQAYAIVVDEGNNQSVPSATFTLTTKAVVVDITPPIVAGFDAGSLTDTSAKLGWYANEPVTGEAWCASSSADLAGSGGPSKRSFPIELPSGQTSASGGSITVAGLTSNIDYWCKLVVFDRAATPNRAESPVFTIRAKPVPPTPPPVELHVLPAYPTDPATKLELDIVTSRPVIATEVSWSLNANMTSAVPIVGQGGGNYEHLSLTVPPASTIFYQGLAREFAGGAGVQTSVQQVYTWAQTSGNQMFFRCESTEGSGCQLTVFSRINSPNGDTMPNLTVDFVQICKTLPPQDGNYGEYFWLTSTSGPDAVRGWWITGEPLKNTGTGGYILPRSRNSSKTMFVAITRENARCPY